MVHTRKFVRDLKLAFRNFGMQKTLEALEPKLFQSIPT